VAAACDVGGSFAKSSFTLESCSPRAFIPAETQFNAGERESLYPVRKEKTAKNCPSFPQIHPIHSKHLK
jgi:hypothetical protein